MEKYGRWSRQKSRVPMGVMSGVTTSDHTNKSRRSAESVFFSRLNEPIDIPIESFYDKSVNTRTRCKTTKRIKRQ